MNSGKSGVIFLARCIAAQNKALPDFGAIMCATPSPNTSWSRVFPSHNCAIGVERNSGYEALRASSVFGIPTTLRPPTGRDRGREDDSLRVTRSGRRRPRAGIHHRAVEKQAGYGAPYDDAMTTPAAVATILRFDPI